MAVATFAMGCFWKPEMIFRRIDAVEDTAVGYAGGDVPNPTYPKVCAGETGHAEVVRVSYDLEYIGYTRLLDVFWQNHDPTTRDRQGADVGASIGPRSSRTTTPSAPKRRLVWKRIRRN